mmetsp:Transcript_16990/g.43924  ORF Transcript_16990/g.43924 Transcript_16990/m.43924 type:complete len:441 (-) Transcript_16990:405-1727(-)
MLEWRHEVAPLVVVLWFAWVDCQPNELVLVGQHVVKVEVERCACRRGQRARRKGHRVMRLHEAHPDGPRRALEVVADYHVAVVLEEREEPHRRATRHAVHLHPVEVLNPIEDVGARAAEQDEVDQLLRAVAVRTEQRWGRTRVVDVRAHALRSSRAHHTRVGEGHHARAVRHLEVRETLAHARLEGGVRVELEHARLTPHLTRRRQHHPSRKLHELRTGRSWVRLLRGIPQRAAERASERRVALSRRGAQRVDWRVGARDARDRARLAHLPEQQCLHCGNHATRATPVLVQPKGERAHTCEAEALAHPRRHPVSVCASVEEHAQRLRFPRAQLRLLPCGARAEGNGCRCAAGPCAKRRLAGRDDVRAADVGVELLLDEQRATERSTAPAAIELVGRRLPVPARRVRRGCAGCRQRHVAAVRALALTTPEHRVRGRVACAM